MQLTQAKVFKLLVHKMPLFEISDINRGPLFYPRCRFTFVPKNSKIMWFLPLSTYSFSESSFSASMTKACLTYYKTLNSSGVIVNSVNPFLYAYYYYVSAVSTSYYHYYASYFPAEEIYDKTVSSVFNTTTMPSTTDEFLTFSAEELGQSLAKVSVQLLGGWAYNQNEHSSRAVHYVLKITKSGGLNEAEFVWTKLPINITPAYYKPNKTSIYSESIPMYFNDSSTIRCYNLIDPGSYTRSTLFFIDSSAIWAESRRRVPSVKDVYVYLALRPDKRTVVAFETPYEFEPEKIFETTLSFDAKQVTWFNNKIIVLEDKDPYAIHILDLDGTVTKVADTTIPQGSNVLLVAHPDQDVCYLFSENEQWILYSDLTHETTTFDLTGLISFNHLQFDIDGYVWFDGSKRDKQLLTEVLNVPNARCNYTYIAVDNGDGTYSAYHLDGTTPIYNLPTEAMSVLFWSGVAYRYPQKVVVPYNATDLQLLSQNGDLLNPYWYGWDGTQWVHYDGSNARLIDSTTIELEDGVQLTFDFSNGGFAQDEYIYFTVAEGIIKDALSEVEIKRVFDLRFWEYHYIDISLSLSNSDIIDNGDGTYSYYIPEASNTTFWELDTFLAKATFDDPEQNGSGMGAEIVTDSGDLASGKVLVDTATGKLTFVQDDIGRTFQMHYYVIVDVDCPY